MSFDFLKMPFDFLISVFSASKKPFDLLKMPFDLLILVFSASKKPFDLLKMPFDLLILVFSASKKPFDLLILVFSASKINFYFLKPQFAFSFSLIHAVITTIVNAIACHAFKNTWMQFHNTPLLNKEKERG
ncbi:hypothetical protein [Tolypothrix sp. VBCCA 56010]|uniref:hypothetical protein n=1 Tax=Tolypothrix sp. VBCCA 56010 TaxID=3137731 RepID=UPI003D7CD16C